MKTHLADAFSRVTCVSVLICFGAATNGHAGGRVAAWGDNYFGQTTLPNGLNNVRAIAGGSGHSLALKANGTIVGWGLNSRGEATPPADLNSVVSIAAGGAVSLALRANGTVVAWGNNSWGQTNIPSDLSRVIAVSTGGGHCLALKADGTVAVWGSLPGSYSNTNVPTGLSGVTAVAAGAVHSLALKADGTVAAWGWNLYGQTNVPAGLVNVVAVAAGFYHSLVLKADGTVVAWGYGYMGQTNVPPGLSDVVAIAAGEDVNLALRADGTLVSWGDGTYGLTNLPPGISNVAAIACGTVHNLALVSDGPPEILEQPADVGVAFQSNIVLSVVARGFEPLGYQWYFNGIRLNQSSRIRGVTHSALTISNAQFSDIGSYTVVVSNAFGSVRSTGAVLTVISPPIITLQPVGQTAHAGTNITLTAAATGTPPLSHQWLLNGIAVKGATGTSLTFSDVQSSQSGDYSLRVTNVFGVTESSNAHVTVLESPPYILNQPTNRSTFFGGFTTFSVNARGSTPLAYQWRFNGADISGATNPTLTLASLRYDQAGFYTVAISNAFGTIVSAKAELQIQQVAVWGGLSSLLPTNVPSGLTNLVAITAGDYFVLGLKADGTVTVWPGLAPRLGFASPTNIPPGLSNVTAIAAGYSHCLALKSNGTVVAWGGSTGLYPYPPLPPPNPTNVPPGLSNVIAIAAGEFHNLALKADGTVAAWGNYGAKLAATNVPAGLSNVIAIAAGGGQSLALRSSGRVVAWGDSTNVPANLSNVIAIACADGYSLALKSDGRVTAWAATIPGYQLPPRWRLPVATNVPPGLSTVVAISAGGDAMALKADGSVVTWGSSRAVTPAGLSNVFAISAGGNFFAALTGDGSPRFTIQPVSQTVSSGGNVSFHTRAVGIQLLRYQWQRDGADLLGATNADLTVTNARGRDAGSYRAIAGNSIGSANSQPAALVIPFSTNLAAALNTTNFIWITSPASAPWFAQIRETHDGDVAAQSGRIGHNQQSMLQTATAVGPGTLSFWWKVSSEEGYDYLRFLANGPDFAPIIARISGETGWQRQIIHLPLGAAQLTWTYAKDSTVSTGQDAGWLDEVLFTPASPLTLSAPRLLADGTLVFTCSDPGGRLLQPENLAWFEVQTSANLRDWTPLAEACVVTNGVLVVRVANGAQLPRQFYRLVEH